MYDKKFENISILINDIKIDMIQSEIKDFKNIYLNRTTDKKYTATFSNKPHFYR